MWLPVSFWLIAAIANAATSAEPAAPASSLPGEFAPELISQIAGHIIAAEIPCEFEGSKDWGRTKRMTTGLRSYGNFFKFDIHRDRNEVNDGIWKRYRLALIDPDKNLDVKIENLRTLETGRIALTLNVAAKVHGWARAVVYEHGVHIISLEAEGDTAIRMWIDAEVGAQTVESSTFIPGVELTPVATDARVKFEDFRLQRISDVRGSVAKELGELLRKELQKKLSGPKFVERLNRSLQKHPEKLRLGKSASKNKATSR